MSSLRSGIVARPLAQISISSGVASKRSDSATGPSVFRARASAVLTKARTAASRLPHLIATYWEAGTAQGMVQCRGPMKKTALGVLVVIYFFGVLVTWGMLTFN